MSCPSNTDLGGDEQACPYPKESGNSGPSRSSDIKADSQLALSLPQALDLSPLSDEEAEDLLPDDEKTETNFNTLPAELRVKIYKMTWEPRRVILARSWIAGQENLLECQFLARTSRSHVYELFDEDQVTTMSTSSARLPVTLWVNSESRYETLRHYEIAFICPRNGSSEVYFNFAIDELEIRYHGALARIITKDDLAKIRGLVLPMGYKNARASYNTLDTLRSSSHRVIDLDEKIHDLYTRGLASGLEPYAPESHTDRTDLRRLAESLQREITGAQGLPAKLISLCPNLTSVRLLPTATCAHWPTEDFATMVEEDDWFMEGKCECLTCLFQWSARHLGSLVADDPEELVWSVGDRCPEGGSGAEREMRLEQVTVSWRARLDDVAWSPDDERCTTRTVADWAVAGTAVGDKLRDPGDAEPLYVL